MSDSNVTLGEVHRMLVAQNVVLKDIQTDVKAQNGKVADHAVRIAVLEERSGGGAKHGAIAGGAVAGIAAVAEILRHIFVTAKP